MLIPAFTLAVAIPLVATVQYDGTATLQFTPTPASTVVSDWWAVDEIDPGISTRVTISPIDKAMKLVEVTWAVPAFAPTRPTTVYIFARSRQKGQDFPAETIVAVRFVPIGWVTPVVSAAPSRPRKM